MGPSDGDTRDSSRLTTSVGELRIPPLDLQQAILDAQPNRDSSRLEAQALATGTLEREAAANSHRRRESTRTCFHWITLAFVLTVAALILIALIVVAIHYLTPWRFLEQDQLSVVQAALGSTFVTALGSSGLKKLTRDLD